MSHNTHKVAEYPKILILIIIIIIIIEEKMFCKAWERFPIDFTHFQDIEDKTYTSTWATFFWVRTFQRVCNISWCLALTWKYIRPLSYFRKINVNKLPTTSETPKAATSPSPNHVGEWQMNSKEIITLLCGSEYHIEEIDDFFMCILNTIKSTADDCLLKM